MLPPRKFSCIFIKIKQVINIMCFKYLFFKERNGIMNNIPGVEFSKKKKNPRIDSDASSFAIDYYKDADYFSNLDNFVKFIKDVERSVRRSKYYKQYIAYLKNDLGLDFCQVLSNVKPDSEDAYTKIEMHHGPILTLFDCVAIVLDHYINTGKKITTFRIAKAIIDEHFELNIQTVNLCETVHEQVHENNVFLNMKMGFGDINTFLNKYSEGIRYNEELKTKINKYIELSHKYDTFDKHVLDLKRTIEKLDMD